MNARHISALTLLAAIAATAAGSVQAQDQYQDQAPSTLTREQVRAETRAALKAGDIPHGDLDISAHNRGGDVHPALTARSTSTRAEVEARRTQTINEGNALRG